MRKGKNTSKEQTILKSDIQHRVILPLYIPNESDYYNQSLDIFKMCITSLQKSSSYPYLLTVVSDGSCLSVTKVLYELYEQEIINELIIERTNIGKLNAILKGLRTVTEPYVTIADSDILFLNHWDTEIFNVFKTFKKAAVVSPIPLFRNQLSFTANIWIDYLFSNQLKFRPVKNPDALEKFAKSIGWDSLEPRFKDVIMTLKEEDVTAVISASHCVATYKTAFLKQIPLESSTFKLGGDSERKYLDEPPYALDGYRLSTYDNYAYHIGNKIEPWLLSIYENLDEVEFVNQHLKQSQNPLRPKYFKILLQKLFLRALKFRGIYNFVLRRKGLSIQQLKQFWY